MFKKIGLVLLLLAFTASLSYAEYVSGHYRSNGTYVQGYQRSSPNSTVNDNYSHQGNLNPYTGERGSSYDRNNPSSNYYGTNLNSVYTPRKTQDSFYE